MEFGYLEPRHHQWYAPPFSLHYTGNRWKSHIFDTQAAKAGNRAGAESSEGAAELVECDPVFCYRVGGGPSSPSCKRQKTTEFATRNANEGEKKK